MRYLFAGVVKGIGDYGNCVGIPTVAGEVVFDPAYEGNPLVNAMCVGLMHEEELIRAKARGRRQSDHRRRRAHGTRRHSRRVVRVGGSVGSERREAAARAGRRSVHREAAARGESLELIRSGHIVAIQDMGAAGLTSSSAEMAARGDVGVTIDVTKVPVREDGHDAVRDPAQRIAGAHARRREARAAKTRCSAILEKWDLTAAVIGEVIAEPVYRVTEGDRVVAEFPGIAARHRLPDVHARSARRATTIVGAARARRARDRRARRGGAIPRGRCAQLLVVADDREQGWVYRQYDTTVRTNTVIGPGGDAAVVRVRGTDKAIALKTDCNGRYVVPRSARRRRASPSPRRRATSRAPARGRWRSRTA